MLDHLAGFPIVGGIGGWGAPIPHPTIFFETPPSKAMPPMGCIPPLKYEAPPPSEKQTPTPPPLKSEAPFHKMILRKSTINNNLESG